MPQLDQLCSKHFTYRQLIECGETWQSSSIDNLPLADESWQALADLATHILDPVYEQFGNLEITYGFCSPPLATARKKLAKEQGVLPSIYPTLDQHSCFETNRKGDIICSRGGAACDFRVPCTSSLEVAIRIVKQLPFDRLYFYGHNKPIHVSYNRGSQNAAISIMTPKTNGQGYIPRNLTPERFLEQFQL
ncbi:hypothetical protein [Endozoicomonas atrinae]|uniref:hypothetical protein n=1 Tax=Endozoicomonas atrinae TaxID=1333660 RepID=UPI0008243D41|nr:hypothetical protein [Endozoicomonas atrinae]